MRKSILALGLTLTALAVTARADVPPENACETPGAACDTAPPDYRSKGVCKVEKCSRQLPGPNGIETHEYACNLCLPPDPGAPPAAEKKGACGVATGGESAVSALLLGALLVVARRRRA